LTPDDRRPFRGAPFERGRNERPAGPPPDRGDRPGFAAQRPFVRPPTRGGDLPPPDHRVRLRDGDREIEVSGGPAFVRQVLDDLPTLMARLRGEAPGRSTISMPAPPLEHAPDGTTAPTALIVAAESIGGAANGEVHAVEAQPPATLEERIFEVLRRSSRPLAIAAIRQRLDGEGVTGQQVRRLLEKAGARVIVSAERPATYSLS
jgi:hypothetical protein